jgi:hypothetical protein
LATDLVGSDLFFADLVGDFTLFGDGFLGEADPLFGNYALVDDRLLFMQHDAGSLRWF